MARGPRPTPPGAPPFPDRPLPFLWHVLRRRPSHHLPVLALVLGAVGSSVGAQYGMKLLVDAMAGGVPAAAWRATGLFLALVVTESAFWRLAGFLGARAILRAKAVLREELFGHLTGHAPRYFAEHLAGALANRVGATAEVAHGLLSTFLWGILPPLADFAGAAIVLCTIDARIALLLGAEVAFVASVLTFFGLRGTPRHLRYAERAAATNGEIVDVIGNIWAVRAFGARERERRRLAEHLERELDAQRRAWGWLEWMRVFHDVCLCLMAGTTLAWVLSAWTRGAVTPGDVVVVSALTFRILHGSRDLALAGIGSVQQTAQLAETLHAVAAPHLLPEIPGAPALEVREGTVAFEDVTFAYPGREPVFEGLRLRIPGGQSVGVVGPSGAGKTTLTSLLQRLDDPRRGRIRIDGQDLREVSQDSLRAALAVVPQEIALFHRSVLENVRYGRPGATDGEVRAALRAARCEGFVDALPDGWHTLVGERGVKLSGGQRQRIGIARALLKGAPILVFDEATSSLDTESERAIQEALAGLRGGRTVLAVAHRLSTVARFDRVVVLVDGRIVEDGPPDLLRRIGGVFAEMWRMQVEGLEEARIAR